MMAANIAGAVAPTRLAERRVLYCIGAQRTGSGWLHAMFRRSPGLHVPALKEVHYWDTIRAPRQPFYRRRAHPDLEWFRQASFISRVQKYHRPALLNGRALERFLVLRAAALNGDGVFHDAYADMLLDGARERQVIVDNTPCYALLGRDTFAEMASVGRDVRFLFVMRDPVQRLWSGIQHRSKNRLADGRMSEGDLVAEFSEEVAKDASRDLKRSDYRRTIMALEGAVQRDKIHYAFYEDLFTQPAFDRICGFADVPGQTIRTWRRVNKATRPEVRPDPAAVEAARLRLAPVYDFIRKRFGDAVPKGWLS